LRNLHKQISVKDESTRRELNRIRREAEEQAFGTAHPGNVAEAESILGELAGAFFSAVGRRQRGSDASLKDNLTIRPPQTLSIEARYRTLVEQIPAVVFMASLDQGISEAYVSPHIEAMLGFTQEEWLNDPVRWYWQIHPDDRGRWNVEAANMFLLGEPLRSVYRVMARDGHTVWFHCEAKMVRSEDGRPWFIQGVAFDITELKEAETALKQARDELEERVQQRTAELAATNRELQLEIADRKRAEHERTQLLILEQKARKEAEGANRAKDEFLATVSHELRTPLNAILGWARMLQAGRLDEAQIARAYETVERNAKAQAQLIEDLLDVSRIISGKLRLDVRPLELASVIEGAIETTRPAAEAKGIRVVTVLDPRGSPVTGDADRLQQVVWNLLSNAIKFTPKGGRVLVRLERVNSHAEITVSDTGVGISPEFLPHVFDRFRQADGSITRSYGGLGLGLAIVRHLVELHGGTVSADSRAGEGATFTVQVPAIALRAVEAVTAPRRVQPTAGGDVSLESITTLDGLRVLVVDDQQDAVEVLAAVLGQCGAEVRSANSAAEALETLQEWKPDVLVSDIGMPGEDGYELIRRMRALEPEQGVHIPAVALSAHARTQDRLRALSAGFEMHVPKPVEPAELVMVIASLTRHRTAQRRSISPPLEVATGPDGVDTKNK
jgi:PAS domain S-box-containing protein